MLRLSAWELYCSVLICMLMRDMHNLSFIVCSYVKSITDGPRDQSLHCYALCKTKIYTVLYCASGQKTAAVNIF